MNKHPDGSPLAADSLRWRWFWRLGAWLLLVLVVVLSLLPSSVPPGFEGGDKLQHLLAYMVLGFCFAALYPRKRRLILLGLIFLGAGLEGLQGLVPARDASLFDLLADALGVWLGLLAAGSPAGALFAWLEQRLSRLGFGSGQSRH
ncbi:VanZ family protein [Thiorhodovibrio frisius]|uniref:VanZ family protein n=1 Tax=Thiorhodovibrio frisius TaxID=631362 RepID=UPI000255DDEF|nr:VanZ family protein [Thiorhodovibrio frisius]